MTKTFLAATTAVMLSSAAAQATTVCFIGCTAGTETKIFLSSNPATTLDVAHLGSHLGTIADFSSTSTLDFFSNGFATAKIEPQLGNEFSNLAFTIPNHTFTDFEFSAQMLKGAPKPGASFTTAVTTTTGTVSHTYTGLKQDADLSFLITAAATNPIESISFSSTDIGFKQMKHFEVSGVSGAVAATPLPAALPLFVGGLTLLGFGAWKRRKRAALPNV